MSDERSIREQVREAAVTVRREHGRWIVEWPEELHHDLTKSWNVAKSVSGERMLDAEAAAILSALDTLPPEVWHTRMDPICFVSTSWIC